MVFGLFRRRGGDAASGLYAAAVEQARRPVFYTVFAVPDTVEGRFELVVLHCGMLVARLGREPATRDAARDLSETFFSDMDRTLREMGIGDVSVPKKMRRIADAFYGRLTAYETAGAGSPLAEALARNVYDGTPPERAADDLAAYVEAAAAALAAADAVAIAGGRVPWPEPVRRDGAAAPQGDIR